MKLITWRKSTRLMNESCKGIGLGSKRLAERPAKFFSETSTLNYLFIETTLRKKEVD